MRLLLIIAVVIGLAACTVPSRDFRGIPAQRITVEGSVFDVTGERLRGERGLGRSGAGRWRVGLRLEGACCG